jgi:bacterial/archaeal transporter family protein
VASLKIILDPWIAIGANGDRRDSGGRVTMNWALYAVLGAIAAGITAILAKLGTSGIPSNLAVLIRTVVVLLFAAALVGARGEYAALREIRGSVLTSLILSGIATGVSWLAYFKALQLAPASWVAPIDKLSLPITILLAMVFLGEPLTWRISLGVTLMVAGAFIIVRP